MDESLRKTIIFASGLIVGVCSFLCIAWMKPEHNCPPNQEECVDSTSIDSISDTLVIPLDTIH